MVVFRDHDGNEMVLVGTISLTDTSRIKILVIKVDWEDPATPNDEFPVEIEIADVLRVDTSP